MPEQKNIAEILYTGYRIGNFFAALRAENTACYGKGILTAYPYNRNPTLAGWG